MGVLALRRRWLLLGLSFVLALSTGCVANRSARPDAPPGTVLKDSPRVSRSANSAETPDYLVSPPPAGSEPAPPGRLDAVGEIVERAQRGATERFGAFMFEVDDFFSGGQTSDEPNTSFLRVRADAVKPVLDDFELDPTIKLRVVLPRAERRFRLLFSTAEDETTTTAEVDRVARTDDDDTVSFALRFVRRARSSVDLDFDIGARRRDGDYQLFGRINAQYRKDLSERWAMRIGNRYHYFTQSGFDNRIRFDLTRQLGNLDGERSRFIRSSTTLDWRATREGAAIVQILGLYADLSEKSAVAVEGVGRYDTKLNGDITDRFRGGELRLRYRRKVWRPWFYVELWPAVAWPAEREYRRTFHGLARIEITIGGEDLAALQPASESAH